MFNKIWKVMTDENPMQKAEQLLNSKRDAVNEKTK